VDTKVENRDSFPAGKGTRSVRSVRKNLLIFTFFLILSFIFWYLNSLGKDLESDIRYPVSYINVPKNKVLIAETTRLSLLMRGPGYSILKLKVSGNSNPLVIDFSKVSVRHLQNERYTDFVMVNSTLLQNFNSQLKSPCKITSVKPDTLFVSFRAAAK
jgi:hypothetical protein